MYSYSRLQTFEQCPQRYKFRYLDNIKTDTEGIEAFMGKRVHEVLEKLYKDLKLTKKNSLDDCLAYYEKQWESFWHSNVQTAREEVTPGHYFELGKECIRNYYKRFDPFNQSKTLGLEERVDIKIAEGDKVYSLQGYIDRLAWVPETETYEIHDYKTSSTVPTQAEADADRQLALYQLALQQRWPDAKKIRLIWHYVAAGIDIESSRTTEAIETLKQTILDVIHSVEEEMVVGNWSVQVSALCSWCDYKPICPAWKHEAAVKTLPANEYANDSGVQLTQKYVALHERIADHQAEGVKLSEEKQKLEAAIFEFLDKEKLLALDSPTHRLLLKQEDEWKAPRKTDDPFAWEMLRSTLLNAKKLESVSTVNAMMLKYAMKREQWPAELVKSVMTYIQTTKKRVLTLLKK